MNRDIKELLNEAVKDEPPAKPLDVDALTAKGSRRLRSNRLGVAGAALSTVAVVTAAALLLPGSSGGNGNPDNSAPAATEPVEVRQPEFPIPELDPDRKYRYESVESSETAETAQLSGAFWETMIERYPELKVLDLDSNELLSDPEQFPVMKRNQSDLWLLDEDTDYPHSYMSDDRETKVFTKPVYGFSANAGLYGALYLLTDEDREVYDEIDLSIHPAGSFEAAPKSFPKGSVSKPVVPHLATGCEDQLNSGQGGTDNFEQDFTCSEATGPNGEPVQVVELTLSSGANGNHDFISMKVITVIVTLENGNAVVISNMISPVAVDGEHGDYLDLTDFSPAMDAEALIELAVSLPPVVVQ